MSFLPVYNSDLPIVWSTYFSVLLLVILCKERIFIETERPPDAHNSRSSIICYCTDEWLPGIIYWYKILCLIDENSCTLYLNVLSHFPAMMLICKKGKLFIVFKCNGKVKSDIPNDNVNLIYEVVGLILHSENNPQYLDWSSQQRDIFLILI